MLSTAHLERKKKEKRRMRKIRRKSSCMARSTVGKFPKKRQVARMGEENTSIQEKV